MPRIASVVFRGGGKAYQFDAGSLEVVPGDRVVVDTTRGADFGRLVKGPDEVPPEDREPPVDDAPVPPGAALDTLPPVGRAPGFLFQ